ncbi:MAG TPA: TRAM domain-containing protein [Candidatus Saccharimonadales bacterium]|nr:TRAM domain-containing protein [Candidatus Saccharimonadales bacterium]
MQIIELILLIVICYLLISQREGSRLPGLSVGRTKQRKLVLDSCGLIDGRIVDVARTGFLADEFIIPQFVLNELQMLADGNDSHKRERARFGLDIAHQLQDESGLSTSNVTIDRTQFPDVPTTDDKLVALARRLKANLYTTDYNLTKVATVEGVQVLNINELAQTMRPVSLPGETLQIKILQKGSNHDQGVGYLEDGTMIVVDGAARYVGKTVNVTVSRMHQTVAGKMVFGQLRQAAAPAQTQKPAAQTQDGRANATTQTKATTTRQATSNLTNKLHQRLLKKRPVRQRI